VQASDFTLEDLVCSERWGREGAGREVAVAARDRSGVEGKGGSVSERCCRPLKLRCPE
jgi:hypothetical protein